MTKATSNPVAPASAGSLPLPVWLLDVDGVLNAKRPGWGGPPISRTAHVGRGSFRMRFAVPMLARLCRLHAQDRVDIRWATTWADDIEVIERIMKLPAWPTAFTVTVTAADLTTRRMTRAECAAAKYDAALRVLEDEGRPLIWTDDDAIPAADTAGFARLTATGVPLHAVRPKENRGLQPADLDAIEEFVSANGHPPALHP